MPITNQDIDRMQSQLANAKSKRLKESGWESTTTTPAHVHLWTRKWRGTIIMVDVDVAIRMQSDYFDTSPHCWGGDGKCTRCGLDTFSNEPIPVDCSAGRVEG